MVSVSRAATGTKAAAGESTCAGAELGGCRAESDRDVLQAAAGGAEVVGMAVEAAVAVGSPAVGCPGIVEVSDTRLSGYVCRRA